MEIAILVLHVLAALTICGLVLLQHGKGADMGAAFGSGSAGSLFGSSGSANFLSRATGVLAAVFFLTSLGLTWFSTHKTEAQGVVLERSAPVGAPGLPSAAVPDTAPAKADGTESKTREIPK